MSVVNTGILKQPINWVIIPVILVIGGIAAHFVFKWGSSGS